LSQSLFQDGKELVLESDASVCGYFLPKSSFFQQANPKDPQRFRKRRQCSGLVVSATI
jgi:ABC-type phosphate/phosphonate transport system substrate-binding protein